MSQMLMPPTGVRRRRSRRARAGLVLVHEQHALEEAVVHRERVRALARIVLRGGLHERLLDLERLLRVRDVEHVGAGALARGLAEGRQVGVVAVRRDIGDPALVARAGRVGDLRLADDADVALHGLDAGCGGGACASARLEGLSERTRVAELPVGLQERHRGTGSCVQAVWMAECDRRQYERADGSRQHGTAKPHSVFPPVKSPLAPVLGARLLGQKPSAFRRRGKHPVSGRELQRALGDRGAERLHVRGVELNTGSGAAGLSQTTWYSGRRAGRAARGSSQRPECRSACRVVREAVPR